VFSFYLKKNHRHAKHNDITFLCLKGGLLGKELVESEAITPYCGSLTWYIGNQGLQYFTGGCQDQIFIDLMRFIKISK
jgi:hypothetical protein